jgi:uncharacterized protein
MNAKTPQVFDFFQCFSNLSDKMVESGETLLALLRAGSDQQKIKKRLHVIEHEADEITHSTYERLDKTFITPIDREDIHGLVSALDDVVDMIYACGLRFTIYNPKTVNANIVPLGEIILESSKEISKAMHMLRDTKNRRKILDICMEVNRIENCADDRLWAALGELFREESDPIELMKTKEILEYLEEATDACERVANRLQGVVLKHA